VNIPGRSISCLALAACLVASGPVLSAKRDNTVRFAYDQAPENVDPFFNNVRIGVIIGQHVWDSLIYRDPTNGEYKGQLATAWRQVDDRTTEFDLRQGVKFHNGEEFDADDVVYTLNFIAKPENKVVTQANVSWIGRAEKIDKYKVRLITKDVFPAAIEYLAGPIVIHPNEYYEKVGPKGQNDKPVGSGPYRVSQHAHGRSITLERNRIISRIPQKARPRSTRSRSASFRTARRSWPRSCPAGSISSCTCRRIRPTRSRRCRPCRW
jgi:peptide/nickel transport system substrate-binding protein